MGDSYPGGEAFFDARPNTAGVWVPLGPPRVDLPFQTLVDRVVPFAALIAKVQITLGPLANDDAFEVKATFTVGAGSDGIAPLTENVNLQFGTFSTTIPGGSFTQDQDNEGRFKFEGVIAGVALEATITPLGTAGSFEFEAEGQAADLTGTASPLTVRLNIGDDGGSTTLSTAEFE